jgi:hypothetical protein
MGFDGGFPPGVMYGVNQPDLMERPRIDIDPRSDDHQLLNHA